MYLRRLRLTDFCRPEETGAYPEDANAFRVCCECATDNPQSAALLDVVRSMDAADRRAFANGMRTLLKVANSGRPLKSHYDEKQCHEAHSFKHKGKTRTVYRIRTSDFRILFYYGNDRIILLTEAFPKHTDKITQAQKNEAERVVKAYLDAKSIIFCKDPGK